MALTGRLPFMSRTTARGVAAAADREWVVDCFAGAGGASLGIEAALGVAVDVGINHDQVAFDIHQINHPHTRHLVTDVWDIAPREAVEGHPVGLAWFSPDCTHFSMARGGRPKKKHIRSLAWVVIRWAKDVRPRVIILENVREFQTWGPLGADDRPIAGRAGETFRRFPRSQAPKVGAGDRVYYVEDGHIRGFALVSHTADKVVDMICETTLRNWPPGFYVFMDSTTWKWIEPIPMRGLQGWRKVEYWCPGDDTRLCLDGRVHAVRILGGWRDPRPEVPA
jgi:hypothetical protein